MFGYIYLTTNKITNKIYIGQHRANEFESWYKGSGKLIQKALKKYGENNFETIMLKECFNQDELNYSEMFYIKEFDARNPNIGYNLAEGGALFSNGYHEGMKGKKQSDFQKEQARKALQGKKKSEKAKENMRIAAQKRTANRVTNGGKIWINNGIENKMISTDADLLEGYSLGMKHSDKKSESLRKTLSESTYMYDSSGSVKLVKNDQVENYLLQGYQIGRNYSNERKAKLAGKGKVLVSNKDKNESIYINPDELSYYIENGYIKGRIKK